MPGPLRFSLVDVFTSEPLSGNPLAVVADADHLEEAEMSAIAREFNQSETTFVLRPRDAGVSWRLRSFTPAGVEVGGAGHNALGAWWWLAESGHLPLGDETVGFKQQIGDRILPVTVVAAGGRPRAIEMEQQPPEWRRVSANRTGLAESLGLDEADFAEDLPAQVVSTGAPHLLVQVDRREIVDRAAPDGPRLAAALSELEGEGCYLFSLDPVSPDSAAYARFFNPTVGIAEDPATGTAAGPLAAHLVINELAPDGSTLWIEQGYRAGRPSRIAIRVEGRRVTISAECVIVAEGVLHP
jgi:PhzF family phenazine biosynthesis protein